MQTSHRTETHSILNIPVDVRIEEARVNVNVGIERAVDVHKTDSNNNISNNNSDDANEINGSSNDSLHVANLRAALILKELNINPNSDYSSISEEELKVMEEWCNLAETNSDPMAFEL